MLKDILKNGGTQSLSKSEQKIIYGAGSKKECFKTCQNGIYIWYCSPLWQPVDMGPCP